MECRVCERKLKPESQWRKLPVAEKRRMRHTGWAPHRGRSLCDKHYTRAALDGTRIDYERASVPKSVVIEEWRLHADRERSDAWNVKQLAPRLGMTVHALEQQVVRLHNAGLLEKVA